MLYTFDQIFAADPANPERVASDGVVTIFAPGDAAQTPIAIKTVDGLAITNPVQVNDAGYGPAFTHDTLDRVAWSGGGFSGFFTSYDGMKNEAVAARVSAQEAAAAAEEAISNTSIPTSESVRRELETDGAPANQAVKTLVATAAAGFAVKPDNGNTPVGKSELVVNAKDFGAKGDGVTDDTAAVQRALDYLGSNGGGTLHFPSGTYIMDDAAYLCSNLQITGQSATLQKRTASSHYAFFIGSSGTSKGYGAGPSNIMCTGITFRGSFKAGAKRIACAFSLHHSENILVYGCRFIEMSGGGHRFDLGGCRNVTIRDNVFEGFDASSGSGLYNEDIQLDFSINGSLSHVEASTLCYDGLPTRDVFVTGNIWRGVTVGGVKYPAANPLGSHASAEARYHENIYFVDNQILGSVVENVSTDMVRGVIHFMCPRNLHIRGNVFENDGRANHAISIISGIGGIPTESQAVAGAPWVRFAVPQVAEDVFIEGNTFKGYYHASTNTDLINIRGDVTGPTYAKRVSIARNKFTNNYAGTENNGPNLVYAQWVESLTIAENAVDKARRLLFASTCRSVNVLNNALKAIRGYSVSVELSRGVSIQGNQFSEGSVGWEVYVVNCTEGTVRGNVVIASPAADPSIRLTASSRFVVDGNVLQGAAGSTKGIEIINASTGNIVTANIVQGYSAPITATAGMALQANNVIAA